MTVDAAGYRERRARRSSARPTRAAERAARRRQRRSSSSRCAPAERRIVHEPPRGPRRRRDLQRGRRARAPRRRRAAARRVTAAAPAGSRSPQLPARATRSPAPRAGGARRAARPERRAPSSVRDPAEAWRVHVADSLAGLDVAELARPSAIADVGAGAGFPGLVLAAALPARARRPDRGDRPQVRVHRAPRSSGRGLPNARVVCERAETWAAGRRAARPTTPSPPAPSAGSPRSPSSPRRCSRGRRRWSLGRAAATPDEEAELAGAAARLAMEPVEVDARRALRRQSSTATCT